MHTTSYLGTDKQTLSAMIAWIKLSGVSCLKIKLYKKLPSLICRQFNLRSLAYPYPSIVIEIVVYT